MAGTAADVKMGVCTAEFGGADLGYTSGGVKCSFNAETVEKMVDQEDAPLDEIVMKQVFVVTVPMAEQNLDRLADLLPGATFITGAGKKKMVMTGASGTSLSTLAKKLILKPVGGDANDWVTLHYAAPAPSIEFSYDKNNVRIYEVQFKALSGVNGFVVFGDETAVAG